MKVNQANLPEALKAEIWTLKKIVFVSYSSSILSIL